MSGSNFQPDSKSKKNYRRKVLKSVAGVGTSTLVFPGVATASDKTKKSKEITEKNLEEIFDEDVTEMTDKELDELVEEKWDEGMGYKISVASIDENCIAR